MKPPKPKKFPCGPYTWTERWVDRHSPQVQGNDGSMHPSTRETFIAADLWGDEEEALITLLHERMHAACVSYGVDFDSGSASGEAVIEALSRGLAQSFRGKIKAEDL